MSIHKFSVSKDVEKLLLTNFINSKGWTSAIVLPREIIKQHSTNHLTEVSYKFTNNPELINTSNYFKSSALEYHKLHELLNDSQSVITKIDSNDTLRLTCKLLIINGKNSRTFSFIIDTESGEAHSFNLEN